MAPPPPPVDPGVIAMLALPALAAMVFEGTGLRYGWAGVHHMGIPIARGETTLETPLEHGAPLPFGGTGPCGVWLGEDELGYWSATVRFGVRGGRMFRVFDGMGTMISGTATLSADRREVVWMRRLRIAPLLLLFAAATGTATMFGSVSPVMGLPPYVFYGAFYAVFAWISARLTAQAREAVLAGAPTG